MPLYKFVQSDIFHNRIESHPQYSFFFYSGSVYYNDRPSFHGAFTSVKATATLLSDRVSGGSAPSLDNLDNDSIVLIDVAGNEVTLKFDKDLTTVDGSVDSQGNVIVGIKNITSYSGIADRLGSAINAITDYDQSDDDGSDTNYTLNITATIRDLLGQRIKLVLEQDVAGTAGNTTIIIVGRGKTSRITCLEPSTIGIQAAVNGSTETNTATSKFAGGRTPDDQGGISAGGVPAGYASLYELNVDRVSGSASDTRPASAPDIIYPFIIKDGSHTDFKTTRIETVDGIGVQYIDSLDPLSVITGSYSMSASISKEYFATNHVAKASSDLTTAFDDETITPNTDDFGLSVKSTLGSKISALQNTLDSYIYLSHHYAYSSASLAVETNQIANWTKAEQEMGLISIPSIFYDSKIEKGTVNLKFYITGTLIGELKDENENGELIQVGPSGSYQSGSVAGVVLYNEGFVLLTGSWDLTTAGYVSGPAHTENYLGLDASSPRWVDFAQTIATGSVNMPSSSFKLDFKGTSYIPTMTMLAHARKGHLNFSNNPTYIKHGQTTASITSSVKFREQPELEIKNTVSSSYQDFTASFRRQTYISKIGIYDKKKNLIGVAKVATPVKKTEERDFTFKLKLDI